jgi:hypothetical protein
MSTLDNEDTQMPDNVNVSDITDLPTKLIIICLKMIVEQHPNDADLGKELRLVFDKIKLD